MQMDLEERIRQITINSNQKVKGPDLEDNQKRWLVIGICLQTILAPTLRKYVIGYIDTLFNKLKNVHSIHQQSWPNVLMTYPPGKTTLNYDAINNNGSIRGRNPQILDYKIQNPVDFSKLFLATNMAQYTGFDDTCDLSALLGILAKSDTTLVGNYSDQIRKDVRNPWAHCNFDEWETPKYLSSFQQINQLIQELKLPTPEMQTITTELNEWETKGFTFLNERSLCFELLTEMNDRTSTLAQYMLNMATKNDSSYEQVNMKLNGIECEMKNTIKAAVKEFQTVHRELSKLKEEACSSEKTKVHIEEEMKTFKKDLQKMRTDIKSLKHNISNQRPNDKPFFYPPNRIDCFVGRDDTLTLLHSAFIDKQNPRQDQVICGLGGLGKTALAIEFAWLFQGSFPGGVFWLSAESDETLEDTLGTLATDINTTGNTSSETFNKTVNWLSSLTRRWLLVVDNFDAEQISSHMKKLIFGVWKRNSKGCMLITTRRNKIEVEESFKVPTENCCEIESFSIKDSMNFLSKRSNRDIESDDEEHVFELFYELGGLPLALEQAAAQIKRTGCRFKDYLVRFKETRINLFRKPLLPLTEKERQRYAITTTWELNVEKIRIEAKEEGLGDIPVLLMQIASFLHADDIPLSIFNEGEPRICTENTTLSDPFEIKRSVEILTRFSLFNRIHAEGLSVHRLVQEVIRSKIEENEKSRILVSAVRMLNKALLSTSSPLHVVKTWTKSGKIERGCLNLWSKLAVHANAIKQHVWLLSDNDDESFCSLEMIKLLQTSAIFNSFQQRQDVALKDQAKMFALVAVLNIQECAINDVLDLKIPLLMPARQCIKESTATILQADEIISSRLDSSGKSLSADVLRETGNKLFKEKRYEDAIQYYTEALRACGNTERDQRLYSNRSIAYLKSKQFNLALHDANSCIDIDPYNVKGHVRKSFAIAELIESGDFSAEMEGAGLSSASIAAVLDETVLVQRQMKIYFPIVCYQIVEPSIYASLSDMIMDMSGARPYTTYILRKGQYNISPVKSYKSCQIVGLEDGVILNIASTFLVEAPTADEFDFTFQLEEKVTLHFENVSIQSQGKIDVGLNGIATFYRCHFENGRGLGDKLKFKKSDKSTGLTFPVLKSRKANFSTVAGTKGSQISLHTCTFTNCPGYSIFVEGPNSRLDIINCKLLKSQESGVVIQNAAEMKLTNVEIVNSGLYGIEVGHDCRVTINECTVNNNAMDGAFFGVGKNTECLMEKSNQVFVRDSSFCHNGLSGLFLNSGSYEIKDSKINNNWAKGIIIHNNASAMVQNNEISANRCGGIRITKTSGNVFIDGNTIRDHNEPDIDIEDTGVSQNRVRLMHNIKDLFKKKSAAPKASLNYCCSCKRSYRNLKSCGSCNITKYCSKECQTGHWREHKNICRILGQNCAIDITMSGVRAEDGSSVDQQSLKRLFPKTSRLVVHVQSDLTYQPYDSRKLLFLTLEEKLSLRFLNSHLYNLCSECGTLKKDTIITKTLMCYASFKNDYKTLSVLTAEFPTK